MMRSSSARASTAWPPARCSRRRGGTSACSSATTGSAARSEAPRSPRPGYLHDVFSAWHPLWVGGAAHAQLGDELARHGLEYLNTEFPTASLRPDGESAFLLRTADANAAELGEEWPGMLASFFPNADLAFGILGTELWSRQGAGLALEGGAAPRPRRCACVRRRPAGQRARLARDDVRVGEGARRAGAVGAAHGPRPRRGRLGLHGAGDRGRRPGGRHADPARRRREAR